MSVSAEQRTAQSVRGWRNEGEGRKGVQLVVHETKVMVEFNDCHGREGWVYAHRSIERASRVRRSSFRTEIGVGIRICING